MNQKDRLIYLLLGVQGQNHHCSGPSAIPRFFRRTHFCGNPPTSASTSLLLWLCWQLLTSACASPLLWSHPHVCECPPPLWAPTAGSICLSERLLWLSRQEVQETQTFSCKTSSSLISICWRTHPVPWLLMSCSGFSQFPTISAGHIQMGSLLFWLLLLGWLASFPPSQLLSPNGKRSHQSEDPGGRGRPPSEEGHSVCAVPN